MLQAILLVLEGFGGGSSTEASENSGPRSPQPAVPQLSSEEIDLRGGSASAGGAVVVTTTTSAKNANAIIIDTISPGGEANAGLCFVRQ